MTPEPGRRTRLYRILRENCGLTHHQARHLIQTNLSHLGNFANVFYRGLQKDREVWQKPAEIVAALSMRQDPKQAGNSILRNCWPDQTGAPEAPFTCASLAGNIVADAQEFTTSQKREMRHITERILRWEEKESMRAWEDRLLLSYLQIQKVL